MRKLLLLLLCFFTSAVFAQNKDRIANKNTNEPDTTIFQKVEVEAQFPGGDKAWIEYVTKVVEKNIDRIQGDRKRNGTCVVQFIVGKDGSITNAEALTMKKSVLAEVAVDAIKNGPKWTPAIQFGKPVKAYRRQPITFRRAK